MSRLADDETIAHIAALERDLAAAQARIAELDRLARDIHYPECWDTMAYPTLYNALHEMVTSFPCSTCNAARGGA